MDFYTLQVFFLANVVKALVLFELPADGLMDVEEEDYCCLTDKSLENISIFFNKYNIQARQKRQQQQQQQEQEKKKENKHQAPAPALAPVPEQAQQNDTDDSGMTDVTQQQQEQEEKQEVQEQIDEQPTVENQEDIIEMLSPQMVYTILDHIKMEMREFLRCCCLFFHFVTDVDFPDVLSTAESDTYENMCKYLGLNTQLETCFDNASPFATIMEMFASHHDITNLEVVTTKVKHTGDSLIIVPCTRPVPQLVTLPDDYSDLINSVSDFSCPNNEREEMKTPTMCLMCGEILCAQSYCCQPDLDGRNVGACTYHAFYCGAEIAPFLRIRDCQIVYLGKNKGCFIQPPYLDEYGETDQGLRRGNPLRLCKARYSKIHLNWLGHGLHEEIARLNELTSTMTTQWHHM